MRQAFPRRAGIAAVLTGVIGSAAIAQTVVGYDPARGYQTVPGPAGFAPADASFGYDPAPVSGGGGQTGGGVTWGRHGAGSSGFSHEGVIEYELLKTTDEDDTILFGDFMLGYMAPGAGIGFEIGMTGYDTGEAGADTAAYGALRLKVGNGEIRAGVPRAALDDFMDIPALGGSRYLDLGYGQLTSSLVSSHYLFGGKTPWGLRYDTTLGNVDLAGSAHQFADEQTKVLDVAAAWHLGAVTLSAGAEQVESDDHASGTSVILGAKAGNGPIEGGLYWSNLENPGDIEAFTAYGTWRPSTPVSVTGSFVTAREDGRESTLYGVSADYTFWQGAYVQGGVTDGDSEDATYDLSVGFKF
ncbi:hypothetical protein [Frigidibacter oleivorans]|uniref:hypothetical protein n=1 Tax=Frigidibacter oleivorans TaxID=2487129 RepID=UPI000F8D4768|nr:hypothetical protein [Frigidibacter oleivorans]